MVVYPFDSVDQMGNAARVVRQRIGLLGDRERDDAGAVVRRLERAMTDPDIAAQIATMRDHMQRYRDEGRLAIAIAALLADGTGA